MLAAGSAGAQGKLVLVGGGSEDENMAGITNLIPG